VPAVRIPAKLLLAILLANLWATHASAHSLGAEVRSQGGKLVLEAYFSDDTPARNAQVSVEDAAATIVATGHTDMDGKWQLPTLTEGQYRVIVDAGPGHRTVVTFNVPAPTEPIPDDELVSEGPAREEFTRTPWTRILIGFAVIGLLAAGLRFALRRWNGRRGMG
jgi:hypothetical protein